MSSIPWLRSPGTSYEPLEQLDQTSPSPRRKPTLTPCRVVSLLLAFVFLLTIIFQAKVLTLLDEIHLEQCGACAATTPVLFQKQDELQNAGGVGDEAWKGLLPPETQNSWQGVVWVPLNETFKMPYGLSLYHALHCLGAIRHTLFHGEPGALQHDIDEQQHMGHCLSYVAQHVLCFADDTIERAYPPKDAEGNFLHQPSGIEGLGEMHTCRDRSKTENTLNKITNMETLRYPERSGAVDTLDSLFEECPSCFGH